MSSAETVAEKTRVAAAFAQFFSGATSGAVTKTAVAPLERIKILLQIQGMEGKGSSTPKYTGIFQTGVCIWREEGPLALYKGNGANVTRIIPVYALKFMFNDTFKDMLKRPGQKDRDMSVVQLLMAGTLAGLFQGLITYPLELVRTRLTLSQEFGGRYKGMLDCAMRTARSEGFLALYKGLTPTLITAAPYVGMQMSFYDLFKRIAPKTESGSTNVFWSLASGALAGLLAQTACYPGDTVRRRLQTNGLDGEKKVYAGLIDCVVKMWRKEGWRAYYKGLGANMVKCLPEAGIQFATYDICKKLYYRWGNVQ